MLAIASFERSDFAAGVPDPLAEARRSTVVTRNLQNL
jgi:hypothetical protein